MNRFFKWIDLFWTLLIQIVCYVLGWSTLPTITVMQDGIKFRMPYIELLFQLYDKNPALYITLILIIGYVITLALFLVLKKMISNQYSNIYGSEEIQNKYAEFQKGAKKLDIVGGDLSFLIESKEQLSKVMQMGSDCRILCMESQNDETRDLYKKLVDANVLIRTYGTKKNDFSNLRGQFKDNHSGESCLLVDKIMVNGKNKYKVIAMDNKYMIQVMKKSFDEVFEKGKNPLIKLICFDMGGVYFDGDFIRDFLQQINTKLSQNIKPRHDQKLILNEKLNLGQMRITEWVEDNIGGRPLSVDERKIVNELWENIWQPNSDMKKLVEELKANNYYVGVFSNMDEQNGDIYKERGDFDVFDVEYQYLSYEVGYTKPHKEFFEHMIKSSKFEPYQILLIDDHEKNVIESKKLGFQAIQYHGDIVKLKTDLKEKGIKI